MNTHLILIILIKIYVIGREVIAFRERRQHKKDIEEIKAALKRKADEKNKITDEHNSNSTRFKIDEEQNSPTGSKI